MDSFSQFKQEWLGRRIGDPLLIGNGETAATMYQCVSLIKQYWAECDGITVDWPGNAIDLWAHTNATVLTKFSRVDSNAPIEGDIVVLKTIGYDDYTEPGHVMIGCGGINDQQFEGLEQNGATGGGTGLGGDAIRVRWVDRSRIAGILRPMTDILPAPYTVEDIVTKTIVLNKATPLWNMVYRTLEEMQANPGATYQQGYQETTAAICHHNNGYSYYMVGDNDTTGFNTLDADDYVAPPPPPPTPPAAPMPIPTDTSPYIVVKTLKGYATSNDAANDQNAKGTVDAGSYYIFNRRNDADGNVIAINVTKILGKPGSWISTAENVPDPEPVPTQPKTKDEIVEARSPTPVTTPVENTPTPDSPTPSAIADTEAEVRTSLQWFMPDRSAIECKVLKTTMATEVFGRRDPITMTKGNEYKVYGTFEKDTRTYALLGLRSDPKFNYFYGVVVNSHADLEPYLDDIYSVSDKIKYGFERFYDSAFKTIDGFFKPRKRK